MKKTAILLFVSLVAEFFILPFATLASYQPGLTKTYLLSKAQTPWSTIALSSMGEKNLSGDHLKSVQSNQPTDYEMAILAITALGENPLTYGNVDYKDKLKSFYNNNQIGSTETLNEDIFGILALVASGESPDNEMINGTKNFLLQKQNPDGGWGWSVSSGSDTDTTAAAISSLIKAGVQKNSQPVTKALEYIKLNQNSDGGFAPDPTQEWGKTSSVATTAWVMWTLNLMGENMSTWQKDQNTPRSFLEASQKSNGSFDVTENSFSPTTTAYAALALSGKYLPLNVQKSSASKVSLRIEGSNNTLCDAEVYAQDAMEAIKAGSEICGFTYEITPTSYGPYLSKIGQDAGSGNEGWQYAVNWLSPQIGATDYKVKTGDQVLWYFGQFDSKLTKLTQTDSQENKSKFKIEFADGQTWKPLANTQIFFGSEQTTSNEAGEAEISGKSGFYKIYGKKPGFVKSNSIFIQLGTPELAESTLSVQIGKVGGTNTGSQQEEDNAQTASFSVEPGSMNYGQLYPGQSKSLTLKIKNSGGSNLTVSPAISGDKIFYDNLTIENVSWQKYSTDLLPMAEKSVDTKLTIPKSYFGSGSKNGKIIFWATSK